MTHHANPNTHKLHADIRRLRASDRQVLVDHFLRLDPETRRLRFGGLVCDEFVRGYAENILSRDSVVFGAFVEDDLHGVAELRGLRKNWPETAEVALSVEPTWQHEGIGDTLLNRLIAAAQNRGVKSLHMQCLRENRQMQHLAKKHDAVLHFDMGEVDATLATPWPTFHSVCVELFGDTRRLISRALHLPV
ncbi:acetyltransferase (GNAT) family protein [Litoreibacter halocynthiae]|uniref:Acetyltransferase (GNAT) family protein n=1 Tax=Litoreibacter halocynthiae TaxID=1242689 RepID=A0A4R7LPI9_9RHOB|nr:GNAT family N-acetyltransferase [Litoreibacter halocynthiae]TDT76786.1 acetyltransferase (GNAT) family protein [Litoreibacter halocynthiae]